MASPSSSIYKVPVEYFSYGSNLNRKTFETRYESWGGGRISYSTAHRASLQGWRLAFSVYGLPPNEPVFASIEPASKTDVVHGMLYRLEDEKSWRAVLETELAPDKVYDVVHVRVVVDGRPVDAMTLVVKPWLRVPPKLRTFVRPSARYRDLVVAGAKAEQFPADYIARISSIPPAPESAKYMKFFGLMATIWLFSTADIPILRPTLWIYTNVGARLAAAKQGKNAMVRALASVSFLGFTCIYVLLGTATLPFNPEIWRKLYNETNRVFSRSS